MFGVLRASSSFIPSCVAVVLVVGCSSGGSEAASAQSSYALKFPSVSIAASTERYVCFSKTLDHDLAVDRLDFASVPNVHHAFVSREMNPQPDGVAECDVVFRTSWLPLLIAGKGNASLQYPAGAANLIPKGAQIVFQLHLLNAGASPATVTAAEVDMHLSSLTNPTPVGIYAFGTQQLSLPPMASHAVSYECTPSQDVEPFAVFAHMHKLGTRMTLEVAGAGGAYQEVYRRDPYDFNNQYIDNTPLRIAKGTKTRITCSYDNTTTATVNYGESTNDEMCYLAGFVPGQAGAFGCVQTPVADAGDGGTCSVTANSIGVGAPCTKGGGECPSGFSCSSDSSAAPGPGFCAKIGCTGASDCGEGATCCSPSQGGGLVQVCLPGSCVPSDCTVKP